jgi:uncharacterized membrane protein YjgN (DUF898 family)
MANFTDPTPVKSYSFLDAMLKAVTNPTQATYRSLAQDPTATAGKGFLWVGIAAAVSSLISVLMLQVFKFNPLLDVLSQYSGEEWTMPVRTNFGSTILSLLCGIPVAAVVAVIVLAIAVGLLHLVARLLGGTGDYGKLVYMIALISVPFSLVSSILAPIPYVGCLSFLITIYVLVLEVQAINAVHQFGIGKAVLTLVVPLIAACLVLACLIAGFGSLIYLTAREVFQNLPQEFPMP